MPNADLSTFFALGLIGKNVFLAGGALRTYLNKEKPSDYDVFFRDTGEDWRAAVDAARQQLLAAGYELLFECPDGFMFTYVLREPDFQLDEGDEIRKGEIIRKVQLICEVPFSDLTALIASFDLAPCCAATDGTDFVFHREFVRAVKFMRLKLLGLSYPVATMGRIYKYLRKGYDKGEVYTEFLHAVEAGAPWPEGAWRKYID